MDLYTMHQKFNTQKFQMTLYTYRGETCTVPLHFHKNFEFLLVRSGSCTVSLQRKSYTLTENDCLLFLPYQIHGIDFPPSCNGWVMTFSQDLIKAFLPSTVGQRAVHPVFQLSPATQAFLVAQLIDARSARSEHIQKPSKELELMAKACMYAVCSEYLCRVETEPCDQTPEAISIQVLQYVADHFQEDISLESVARQLGYNYQYVSRIFNRTVGLNFKSILNQYRFEYAAQLLRETDKTITDIAFESGFQSLRTFNRVSDEMYHVAPKQLRKEKKAKQTKQEK